MNNKFDEAKLTAYVLGELSEAEAKEVEARIETSPELKKQVTQIRETVAFLKKELSREPTPILTDEQRDAVLERSGSHRRKFHQSWYFRVAGVAAAFFMFVVILNVNQNIPQPEEPTRLVYTPTQSSVTATSDETAAEGDDSSNQNGSDLRSVVEREEKPANQVTPSVSQQGEIADRETRSLETGSPPTKNLAKTDESLMEPSSNVSGEPVESKSERDKEQAAPNYPASKTARQQQANRLDPAQFAQADGLAEEYSSSHVVPGGVVGGVRGGVPAQVRGVVAPDSMMTGYRASRTSVRSEAPPVRASADLPAHDIRRKDPDFNTEAYDRIVENPFIRVSQDPLSTFSIDVDTASYSNMRRFLNDRQMPPKDAVRIEELINYFSYDYEGPKDDKPFAVHLDTAPAPWKPAHLLVRIGLKGKTIPAEQRKPGNLVFLLDVSGSMQPANKLPLLKKAFRMLVNNLTENDRVAIVVYAGASGLVLPSTECSNQEKILDALERLRAGGSTNGGKGIQLAYKTAEEHFIEDGINRVILATDGDFNVGVTNQGDLTRLIEEKAKSGVFLTVLGFGMGNYKDSTLEKLADKGNGNYAYIDTEQEARKVLVEEIGSTLVTIAKDVKIQIEFNPAQVNAYRLVGYENRMLRHQDFNDDTKDAGEIGAGHTVTALYEVVPVGVEIDIPSVDPLKYQSSTPGTDRAASDDLMTVKLRYKKPDGDTSQLIEFPLRSSSRTFEQASDDFRFASAVASFGMILRDSEYQGNSSFDQVVRMAENSLGEDRSGYRKEFVTLVKKARALKDLDALE